jgi:hypothetical protein
MTKPESPRPTGGAAVEGNEKKGPVPPAPISEKPDDREYDHRGVLMPRRTRIGGIIMPQ